MSTKNKTPKRASSKVSNNIASTIMIEGAQSVHNRRGPRGGVTIPFPERLHSMLRDVERDGLSHCISWQSHGRSFLVHEPKQFVAEVMPVHFNQTKITSFQRQLNLYGFCRLTSGLDRGAYYHALFLRGQPHLVKNMLRTRIKGTGTKQVIKNLSKEPDFYNFEPLHEMEQQKDAASDNDDSASAIYNDVDNKADLPVATKIGFPDISFLLGVQLLPLAGENTIPKRATPMLITPPATPSFLPLGTTFLQKIPDALLLDRSFTPSSPLHQDDEAFFEGRKFHYLEWSALEIQAQSIQDDPYE